MKAIPYFCAFLLLSCSSFVLGASCEKPDFAPFGMKNTSKTEVRILLKETVGPVVPVTELDLASLLQRRVLEAQKLGMIRASMDKTRKALRNHAREPVNLNLPYAKESKTWRFTLMRDKDLEKVSPDVLEALQAQKRSYAFIDADNTKHRKWAMGLTSNAKDVPVRLVSVKGDRIAFEKETGVSLFSDQGGVLTRRFAVKEIPALVRLTHREGIGQTFP